MSTRFADVTLVASNAVPPQTANTGYAAREAPRVSHGIDGKGLSFEDLRVDPLGKVPSEIGSAVVPARMAGPNSGCSGGDRLNSDC